MTRKIGRTISLHERAFIVVMSLSPLCAKLRYYYICLRLISVNLVFPLREIKLECKIYFNANLLLICLIYLNLCITCYH